MNAVSKQYGIAVHTAINYGVGDLGLNLYWQGASFFLLYYFTDILHLPAALAGLIYAVGSLVDAVSDPLLGYMADRTRSRWGRFRPYLLFGAAPLGAAFVLLFWLPQTVPPDWVAISALLTLLVFWLCYTVVSIPYGALAGRLTNHSQERVRLAGARMMCGAMGGGVIALGAFYAHSGDGQWQLDNLALPAAVTGTLLIWWTFSRTQEIKSVEPNTAGTWHSAADILKTLAANRPFAILMAAMVCLTAASTIVVATLLHRFDGLLQRPDLAPYGILGMAALPLLSLPIWTRLYLQLGCGTASVIGGLITIGGLGFLAAVQPNATWPTLTAYVIAGTGFSAFAVGFWSMLPDTIDFGRWQSGMRLESVAVGLASAIQKGTIALSGLIIGLLLSLSGYEAGATSESSQMCIHLWSSIVPLLLMLAATLLFWAYPLSPSRQAIVQRAIKRSRSA